MYVVRRVREAGSGRVSDRSAYRGRSHFATSPMGRRDDTDSHGGVAFCIGRRRPGIGDAETGAGCPRICDCAEGFIQG